MMIGSLLPAPKIAEIYMPRLSTRIVATVLLSLLATPALAAAASPVSGPSLVGTWKVNVACKTLRYVNVVNIGRADRLKVLGTTNVEDAYGKIISGSFDGTTFQFKNTYLWNGHRHHEIWNGSLSKAGNTVQGTFVSDGEYPGESNCRFIGTRL